MRTNCCNYWKRRRNRARGGVLLALLSLPSCWAQSSAVLTVGTPAKLMGKRGDTLESRLTVQLKTGFHVNSNAPNDEYLIPLRLTWDAAPLTVGEIVYPKPQLERAAFSEKPVSVFSGDFEIVTRFRAPASAAPGMSILVGKLRYQACNDKLCLPPKTVEVKLPLDLR